MGSGSCFTRPHGRRQKFLPKDVRIPFFCSHVLHLSLFYSSAWNGAYLKGGVHAKATAQLRSRLWTINKDNKCERTVSLPRESHFYLYKPFWNLDLGRGDYHLGNLTLIMIKGVNFSCLLLMTFMSYKGPNKYSTIWLNTYSV